MKTTVYDEQYEEKEKKTNMKTKHTVANKSREGQATETKHMSKLY